MTDQDHDHAKIVREAIAYCNKCGFCGKPGCWGQHNRPLDGWLCNYAAPLPPAPEPTP